MRTQISEIITKALFNLLIGGMLAIGAIAVGFIIYQMAINPGQFANAF